jgi:hypothetical protein
VLGLTQLNGLTALIPLPVVWAAPVWAALGAAVWTAVLTTGSRTPLRRGQEAA